MKKIFPAAALFLFLNFSTARAFLRPHFFESENCRKCWQQKWRDDFLDDRFFRSEFENSWADDFFSPNFERNFYKNWRREIADFEKKIEKFSNSKISENEKNYEIFLRLKNFSADEIEIETEKNQIVVRARNENKNFLQQFSFSDADFSAATAEFSGEILQIKIPKKFSERQKIPILEK